jgi:hypothetical protein
MTPFGLLDAAGLPWMQLGLPWMELGLPWMQLDFQSSTETLMWFVEHIPCALITHLEP